MALNSARSDAAWNLLGSLVYAGCQWIVLVATVKLSTPAQVGRLSLGFAVTAPIFLLLQLRLRAASATDSVEEFKQNDYVLLRLLCTLLAVLVTLVVCRVAGFTTAVVHIVLWVALAKAIESGSDLVYGLSQQRENLRAVALSMSLRGLLSSVAFVIVLQRTQSLELALSALCAAWGAVLLALDLPQLLRRSSTGRATLRKAGRLAWLTLPLGVSTMFMSLTANMPRYFVQHTLGVAALGIFSAAGYLTMTGSVVISAIAESSLARLSRLFAGGEIAEAAAVLRKVRDITLVLSGALLAASVVAGKQILVLVYKAEYGNARVLLVAMMVAAGAANLASVYGYVLIAARRFHAYLGSLLAAAVATAAMCAVLIPHWGTEGAAFSCLIGYGVQLTVSRLFLQRVLNTQRAGQTRTLAVAVEVQA